MGIGILPSDNIINKADLQIELLEKLSKIKSFQFMAKI
jgi:hypothetical protein